MIALDERALQEASRVTRGISSIRSGNALCGVAARVKRKGRGKGGKREGNWTSRGGCHVARLPYLTRHVPLFPATSSENRPVDPSINQRETNRDAPETGLFFFLLFPRESRKSDRAKAISFDRARLIDFSNDRKLRRASTDALRLLFSCRRLCFSDLRGFTLLRSL